MKSKYSNEDKIRLNVLANILGYLNINQLMRKNGYASLEDLAYEHGFSDFQEFINAPGYYCRLEKLVRRPDKNTNQSE